LNGVWVMKQVGGQARMWVTAVRHRIAPVEGKNSYAHQLISILKPPEIVNPVTRGSVYLRG
jgi:hypothetical protein